MTEYCHSKRRYLSICDAFIRRDGISKLVEWLEKSDFFTAPASAKFHGACAGGLVGHSLNVYDQMRKLCTAYSDQYVFSDESIAIVTLFHDLCKVNLYKPDTRNVKVNGAWTVVPTYSYDEKFVYGGHGSKSVFLAERFMRLELDEAVAINCHMGSWDGDKNVGSAYEQCPLAWFLHVADEASTFLIEGDHKE